jgi:uncharacterized protein (TIGR02271 family)
MAYETIVAVFDAPDRAEEAVRDLETAGVPSSAITRHASQGKATATTTTTAPRHEPGFWSRLFGEEPEYQHEGSMYDRSVESGSTVVSVRVDEAHTTHVVDILERYNPIELDEHSAAHGAETASSAEGIGGSTGYGATGVSSAASGVGSSLSSSPGVADTGVSRAPHADTDTGESLSSRATVGVGGRTAPQGQETISLSEEQVVIGKRAVNRGTTRVRRYVIETPVEEAVSLRDETVSVSRRPASGERVVGDDAFTDKTIEVTEVSEEPVVSKTAHVREEVVINKQADERTETVRDTVRREDVEISKDSDPSTTPTRNPVGRV